MSGDVECISEKRENLLSNLSQFSCLLFKTNKQTKEDFGYFKLKYEMCHCQSRTMKLIFRVEGNAGKILISIV